MYGRGGYRGQKRMSGILTYHLLPYLELGLLMEPRACHTHTAPVTLLSSSDSSEITNRHDQILHGYLNF